MTFIQLLLKKECVLTLLEIYPLFDPFLVVGIFLGTRKVGSILCGRRAR